MLKLLRWEWETKLKKAFMLWVPVLLVFLIISLIMQEYISDGYTCDTATDIESILCFINTAGGRLFLLGLVSVIAVFIWTVLLMQTVLSIIWDEKKMKSGYLLFTTPEPVSKILLAKLVASLPLLLMIAVVNPMFGIGELAWWLQVIIFYAVIMLVVFASILRKTALAGKWYKEHLSKMGWLTVFVASFAVVAFFDFFDVETLGLPYYLVLLLVGVSIVLFFGSVYLLENEVDI